MRWLCFVLVFGLYNSAWAADIVQVETNNLQLKLIIIQGDFQSGDEQKFANIAIKTQSAIVLFQSNGGSAHAAMEIGKAIRIKGFSTYVPKDLQCVSACALAWLGGRSRLMSSTARIGFHAVYTQENGEKAVHSAGNALVGAYLTHLGLSDSAVVFVTSAPPDGILWFGLTEAQQYGIEAKIFDIPENVAENSAPAPEGSATLNQARIETEAVEFVQGYAALESEEADISLRRMSQHYADTVFYYGKAISKQSALGEYAKFVQRWPKRRYSIRKETMTVKCDGLNKCNVDTIIDWVAESEDRNAKSVGVSTWNLGLTRQFSSFIITSINGKVLRREITQLDNGIASWFR